MTLTTKDIQVFLHGIRPNVFTRIVTPDGNYGIENVQLELDEESEIEGALVVSFIALAVDDGDGPSLAYEEDEEPFEIRNEVVRSIDYLETLDEEPPLYSLHLWFSCCAVETQTSFRFTHNTINVVTKARQHHAHTYLHAANVKKYEIEHIEGSR